MKVFLGGTCNDSNWREKIIPFLRCEYYNPAETNWNAYNQAEEFLEKGKCDYILVVTSPKENPVYCIADGVDLSNKAPEKLIWCMLKDDEGHYFDSQTLLSLLAVGVMIEQNGATVLKSLQEIVDYLNDLS